MMFRSKAFLTYIALLSVASLSRSLSAFASLNHRSFSTPALIQPSQSNLLQNPAAISSTKHSPILFHNLLTSTQLSVTSGAEEPESHLLSTEVLGLGAWITLMSSFIVANYVSGPWPAAQLEVSSHTWSLLHALSSMIFAGTITVSTGVEWLVVKSQNPAVVKFWFLTVPELDSALVVPALMGAIVSGVAQANVLYGGLRLAPKFVVGTLHCLVAFALWWAITDLTTQRASSAAVEEWIDADAQEEIPRVVLLRRWSNVVSCLFVAALYAIMVLKPGYY